MAVALILIIWTWGLTPTWVNIIITILMGLHILANVVKAVED